MPASTPPAKARRLLEHPREGVWVVESYGPPFYQIPSGYIAQRCLPRRREHTPLRPHEMWPPGRRADTRGGAYWSGGKVAQGSFEEDERELKNFLARRVD